MICELQQRNKGPLEFWRENLWIDVTTPFYTEKRIYADLR